MHKLIINEYMVPHKGSSIFKSFGGYSSITMTRVFHPVGQGAFFSEVFSVEGGGEFTVVYDCGTESGEASMNNEIDAFVAGLKKKEIDILFVSHFHKDHISGLDRLASRVKIKKTVIPMLPSEVLLVTRVHNYLACEARTKEGRRKEIGPTDDVIRDLFESGGSSERFGEIVSVGPYNHDIQPVGWLPVAPVGIKSGKEMSGVKDIWKYIPFNSVDVSDDRAKRFKDAVKDMLLDGKEELIVDKLLHGLRGEVRDLYKEIMGKECGDDNLYTLAVESLPADGYEDEHLARESRCLFTGDLDSVGNDDLWGRFADLFKFNDIGTIQVPHHGSKDNWRPEFITKDSKRFVVSVGTSNTYHHPDFWAMESIRKNDKLLVVTEDPVTKKPCTIRVLD